MDLELSEDQRELRSVARQVLGDAAPLRLARDFLDGGGDATALATSLADLGRYRVGTDDDPFGVPGLCLLAEQCGAHAAPTALVDTAVAVRLARSVEDPAPLVARIAAGEVPAALAVLEPGGDWSLEDLATEAVPGGDGFILDGTKVGVQHATGARRDGAEVLAVIADWGGTPGAFFVARSA